MLLRFFFKFYFRICKSEDPFCLFACSGFFHPTQEFFTYMETLPLSVTGCWSMLGAHGHWAVRVFKHSARTETRLIHTYNVSIFFHTIITCIKQLKNRIGLYKNLHETFYYLMVRFDFTLRHLFLKWRFLVSNLHGVLLAYLN